MSILVVHGFLFELLFSLERLWEFFARVEYLNPNLFLILNCDSPAAWLDL